MKKLTLDNINLETVTQNYACDFCGEEFGCPDGSYGVKAAFPYKYRRPGIDKKEIEDTYWAVICFNCVRQLAKLIDKEE